MLSGVRVIGLGGAYAPLAEGVGGYAFNPAAAAQRVPWNTSRFDWELDGGFTRPSSITGFDFDNNGDNRFTNSAALFLTGGFGLQFGHFGIGLSLDLKQYNVASRASGSDGLKLNVDFLSGILAGAYAFLDGQLLVGLGASVQSVSLTRLSVAGESTDEQEIGSVNAPALHFGALWAPVALPLRVGASVRYALPAAAGDDRHSGVERNASGDYVSEGYYLPRTLSLPTEVQAGVAVQLFRPLNFLWVSPHDEDSATARAEQAISEGRGRRAQAATRRLEEARAAARDGRGPSLAATEAQIEEEKKRAEAEDDARLDAAKKADRERRLAPYRKMPREQLLLCAAVKVTAPTSDGVGIESFLRQEVERSGETVSISPRLGVESEVVPGYLVVRAGSYYEPTRFATSHARVHGTTGVDVRIPIAWSVFGLFDDQTTFRVGGAIDATARYFGWGVSAGVWR